MKLPLHQLHQYHNKLNYSQVLGLMDNHIHSDYLDEYKCHIHQSHIHRYMSLDNHSNPQKYYHHKNNQVNYRSNPQQVHLPTTQYLLNNMCPLSQDSLNRLHHYLRNRLQELLHNIHTLHQIVLH